jgi:hypothetical protein
MPLWCAGVSDEDEDALADDDDDDDDSKAEHDAALSFGSLDPPLPLRTTS